LGLNSFKSAGYILTFENSFFYFAKLIPAAITSLSTLESVYKSPVSLAKSSTTYKSF
jgi:hypothetical protein